MNRTACPEPSSSGTSRPPTYPDAPVTRQRSSGDTALSLSWPAGAVIASTKVMHCRALPARAMREAAALRRESLLVERPGAWISIPVAGGFRIGRRLQACPAAHRAPVGYGWRGGTPPPDRRPALLV